MHFCRNKAFYLNKPLFNSLNSSLSPVVNHQLLNNIANVRFCSMFAYCERIAISKFDFPSTTSFNTSYSRSVRFGVLRPESRSGALFLGDKTGGLIPDEWHDFRVKPDCAVFYGFYNHNQEFCVNIL